MSGLFGGGGGSTVVQNAAPMSEEEKALIALQTQLSQKQLDSVNQLQPYQQELLDQSLSQLKSQSKYQSALDAAITPEDQAAAAAAEFKQAQSLGPLQAQLLQMQLDQLKQGTGATDLQKKQIGDATDAAIAAGTGDINTQTQRGIGMISDELANSRGLRLSDSPIGQEAALLTRAGNDQVGSLTKNLRAGQASAVLNYPLAAQQLQSGINLSTQSVAQATQNFQDQLRQQAYQNRVSMMQPAITTGLGLSSIGNPGGAIGALNSSRGGSTQTSNTASGAQTMQGIGAVAGGVAALAPYAMMAFSDRRLKDDYGVVGETTEGIGLHLYRYKGESKDAPVRLGVMADEVKKIKPKAVRRHSSGYDVVDYAGIGLAA